LHPDDYSSLQMKPDLTPEPRRTLTLQDSATPVRGTVSAEQLFRGAKEIVIRHHGDDYRLRITRNDKLILTK